jgi:hypothetical protein
MKPAKEVDLSDEDIRRVLAWAQAEGARVIAENETELARHTAINDGGTAWRVLGGMLVEQPRAERMDHLRHTLALQRHTYARLVEFIRQMRDVRIDKDARDIAASVLANRRAERKAENDKRTVREQRKDADA